MSPFDSLLTSARRSATQRSYWSVPCCALLTGRTLVVQAVLIADVSEERLVGFLGLGPIDAVHIGRVETVLHDAPAFLEHLPALGRVIDLHTGREVDAARFALRGRVGRLGGGTTAPC